MKNIYNDNKMLSEEKLIELSCAYAQKLESIKTLEFENFDDKFDRLIEFLMESVHFCENLIKTSKSKENLEEFSVFKKEISNIIQDLKNLYDKNDDENEEVVAENNFSNNKTGLINSLICFLENLFDFMELETNIKIKSSLNNIVKKTLEILKNVNIIEVKALKIVSLFRR